MEAKRYVRGQRFAFWSSIVVCLAVVAVFETGLIAPFDVFSPQVAFVVATVMELLTICVIPFALRFMKFGFVARRIKRAEGDEAKMQACHKMTLYRLTMLTGLMLVNTLLYYLSALTVAYGYMAIILLISLGFVYPSLSRFLGECGVEEVGS